MLATARSRVVDVCPKAIPTTDMQGVRAFMDTGWVGGWEWGRGDMQTAQSALTVILKLVIGLTSVTFL